jgi:hypothetical protein
MMTVVHFRTGGGRYCVPVDAALAVRFASGLVELPAPPVSSASCPQKNRSRSCLSLGQDEIMS